MRLPQDWPVITDEQLEELDAWYAQFTSNSFELKFCDADYWGMRARLRGVEARLKAALAVVEAARTYDYTLLWDARPLEDALARFDAVAKES